MTHDKYFIYALQYNPTKKMYIGSTVNLVSRYKDHLTRLKNGRHYSKEFQKDFDDNGKKEDFSVYVLEEIEQGGETEQHGYKKLTKHRIAEYKWMKTYKTVYDGYNIQDVTARKSIESDNWEFPLKKGRPALPKD